MLSCRHLLSTSLLVGCGVLLSACGPASQDQPAVVISGKTMGTYYRVSMVGLDKSREPALREQIEAQLKKTIISYRPIKAIRCCLVLINIRNRPAAD